jgi:hypothetical protein
MTTRLYTVALAIVLGGTALAQQPAPAPPRPPRAAAPAAPAAPPAQPAPPAPPATTAVVPEMPAGQLVNIRIEVAVIEEGGTGQPSRKTVSLTLADRQNGSVRATASPFEQIPFPAPRPDPAGNEGPAPRMNVDVFPMMQRDGRAQVQLTLDYGRPGAGTSIRVEPLLESGKPMVVSHTMNPASDRRISVEMTATIVK